MPQNRKKRLGGRWNGRSDVHSMANLGLGDTEQMKLVWIDVCFNGAHQDMADAWMRKGLELSHYNLYISWNGTIWTDHTECFAQWTDFFFRDPDGFGLYGTNTYYQAREEAGKWNHVCSPIFVLSKVATYGDESVRFSGNRNY